MAKYDECVQAALFGSDGLRLGDLRLTQDIDISLFPSFIPLGTLQLPLFHDLSLLWIGVRLERLMGKIEKVPERARVPAGAKLIAVLNGLDPLMERFWGRHSLGRKQFFERLKLNGFDVVTGPTFSVFPDRTAIERLSMLHRHHRVVQEAHEAGLVLAPNLFWNNEFYARKWTQWFKENPEVKLVARDLSCTHPGTLQRKIIDRTVKILDETGRSYHILFTGIGCAGLPDLASRLGESNHSFSILTPDPIVSAVKGGWRLVDRGDHISKEKEHVMQPHRLALQNVRALIDFADRYSV